jgi:hypothetical protein
MTPSSGVRGTRNLVLQRYESVTVSVFRPEGPQRKSPGRCPCHYPHLSLWARMKPWTMGIKRCQGRQGDARGRFPISSTESVGRVSGLDTTCYPGGAKEMSASFAPPGLKRKGGWARRDGFHGFRGWPEAAAPLHPWLSVAPLGRKTRRLGTPPRHFAGVGTGPRCMSYSV